MSQSSISFKKIAGKSFGPLVEIAGPALEVAHAGYKNGPNRAQEQGVAVGDAALNVGLGTLGTVGLGAAVTGLGLTGMSAAAVGTGGIILIPIGAMFAASYAKDYCGEGYYSESDKMFQPGPSKGKMIGVANQQFRDQLLNPHTGRIEWLDLATVDKAEALLAKHVEHCKGEQRKNYTYYPRSLPHLTVIGFSDPFGFSEGVMANQSAASDLQIAESALTECVQHKKDVIAIAAQVKAFNQAIKPLTGRDDGYLELPSLDRDNDGVLTKADRDAVELKINNKEMSDLLFKSLGNEGRGITFKDQSIKALMQAQGAVQMATVGTPQTISTGLVQKPAKTWYERWVEPAVNFVANIVSGIGSGFHRACAAITGKNNVNTQANASTALAANNATLGNGAATTGGTYTIGALSNGLPFQTQAALGRT